MSTRAPAVAGSFYAADPAELADQIERYLEEARGRGRPVGPRVPKAVIVPHAGYVYSGPIAASAFLIVRELRESVQRVVLFGPSHRVYLRGLALPSCDRFQTPLGSIEIDHAFADAVLSLPQVEVMDAAHAREHSLEVQLPFLQQVLGQFSLVPFSVGDASASEVAEVMRMLWGGEETLIVVSSDLSHYLPYDEACREDHRTSRSIESLEADALDGDSACGFVPVSGLLELAREKGLQVETVDLRNSGDTAGSRSEVVGYGAYLLA